ncbi:MAG: hypothetical protein J0L86_02615 [Flavobacteriales bacterium]|nr:hypothetical protein [Flavobacteriales bacterium]
MSENKSEIGKYLREQNIKFNEIVLENEVHSVNDVANLVQCDANEVLKALVFISNEFCVLVIINGANNLNKEKLEIQIQQKVKLADKTKVFEVTGFEVGTVSPFILNTKNNFKVIASNSILRNRQFFIGSGTKNVLIQINKEEFFKVFKGQFIDL